MEGDKTEILDILDDSSSGDDPSSEFKSKCTGRQASPTLSSPTRMVPSTQTVTTQAAFQDRIQFIDLDVPNPDERWQDENIQSSIDPEPDPNTQLAGFDHNCTVPETQPTLPNTQALLDSRTQIVDLDVADPDGGWDAIDQMLSSPPPVSGRRSASPPVATIDCLRPEEEEATVDDFVNSQKALGYQKEDIFTALKATSMDYDRAEYVLIYMKTKGNSCIPEYEPGVWTEKDDADLHAQDARGWMRVQEKHGNERCDERWDFKEFYKDS